MPRQGSSASFCFDVIIVVSMIALMGHLSVNFWERFIIQKELTNMKTSLHSLKETINQIGFAYDGLHRELTGLSERTEKKILHTPVPSRETAPPQCEKFQCLRRSLHDIQIQAVTKGKNDTTSTRPAVTNNTAQVLIKDNSDKNTQIIPEKKKNSKSASTMTRYPPKSTGVGLEDAQSKTDHKKYYNNYHYQIAKCCKDHGCYNAYENWKF